MSFDQKRWEDICDGCGLCCTDKYRLGGKVYYKETKCQFHDDDVGCTVYPNRQTMRPDCVKLTPWNVEAIDWLPATCAYKGLSLLELERFR